MLIHIPAMFSDYINHDSGDMVVLACNVISQDQIVG